MNENEVKGKWILSDKEAAIISAWRKADLAGIQRIVAAELTVMYELQERITQAVIDDSARKN